jgi:hypothetical protein
MGPRHESLEMLRLFVGDIREQGLHACAWIFLVSIFFIYWAACGLMVLLSLHGCSVVLLALVFVLAPARAIAEGLIAKESTIVVEEVVPVPTYREAIAGLDPMGLHGVDLQVAHILRNYYEHSLGGRRHWSTVESIRFEGVLKVPQGALSFVAFKKKPDYCKIVLFGAGGARIVMAYDGVDAWQLNTAESVEPVTMPPVEALNFIRDATTGGHLLYPVLPGKHLELLGTRRVGEYDCYDLRVTLQGGQQVTYAIDKFMFEERQQIVVNAGTGETEVTTHARMEKVDGLVIPLQSTMTVDGVCAHEVWLRSVEVNLGLMPWMFSRPSGAYIPGSVPPPAPELEGRGLLAGAAVRFGGPARGGGVVRLGVRTL